MAINDPLQATLTGWDKLTRRLEALPEKVRRRIGNKALGKAAAVVKKAAKANAAKIDDPETGRQIADNIAQRVRSKRNRRTGTLTVSVGVLTETGRIPPGNPDTGRRGNTPHWHLVELGTSEARPQPILQNALSQNVENAITAFQREFSAQLDKEA